MIPENACMCVNCQSACIQKPGWFRPEQIAPLAERMGLTVKELFDKHLAVDWWVGDSLTGGRDVFILSPAVISGQVGDMFPSDPTGTCVWFKEGKCEVHTLGKPNECAFAHHDRDIEERMRANRNEIVKAWNTKENQQMICTLLGRTPEAKSWLDDFIFYFKDTK